MEQIGKGLLSWASLLDDGAREQAVQTASLPFIRPHLALMPDAHWGMGSTVGSVIPTDGVVMPAAVGVDIGCFTGDTEVLLADSRTYRLSDLAAGGAKFVVYTCSESGLVRAAEAAARRTRSDAPLVAVTLDNGETVRCTPDHEFMLRDGTYRRADELGGGQSLMPMYGRLDEEGYFRVQQPHSGAFQRAHWIMARSGLLGEIPSCKPDRTVIHHKNFDEADNRPENLEFMSASGHASYHRGLVDRNTVWHSAEFERARLQALAAKAQTPEGYAYFAERGTANIVRYMAERREHFLAAVAGNGQRGKRYLIDYNTSEKGRAKAREMANSLHPCPDCGVGIRSWIGVYNHRRREHGYVANHKVVSVVTLAEREDVFCLTVPEHGNFALAAGVFVHNCGMSATRTQLTKADIDAFVRPLSGLREAIEREVPVSVGRYRQTISPTAQRRIDGLYEHAARDGVDPDGYAKDWPHQLGSLGSGNHFIELCLDEADRVWVFLHSGSRGVGNRIAKHHVRVAQRQCERWHIALPNPDLAYLPEGDDEFWSYIRDLRWAQAFAAANRAEMVDRITDCLREWWVADIAVEEIITCHHNYTERERHFGRDVWLTRKGAINAEQGRRGLIPGSMGTRSYVVTGKGCRPAFNSAPHGAGRAHSRRRAREKFTVDQLTEAMTGIEWRSENADAFLDEIPEAYKSIDQVMLDAADLVTVDHTLRQILNVKGD